jgi:light-regulated signal transduction histidine kinase (bacteriophytochrome)
MTRYLGVIENSSSKMGQLIDGLLALSRVGRRDLNVRSTPLCELVETAIDLVHSDTATAIEWRVGTLPTWKGDPTLLQQVFTNLLANAVKFSRDRHPAIIEIDCLAHHTIRVRDNGVGFSMKYADQLFGAFQRLHSQQEFEGTGIGLAIVQRIIHRHGGKIWAESVPDQGAAFYFQLGSIILEEKNQHSS